MDVMIPLIARPIYSLLGLSTTKFCSWILPERKIFCKLYSMLISKTSFKVQGYLAIAYLVINIFRCVRANNNYYSDLKNHLDTIQLRSYRQSFSRATHRITLGRLDQYFVVKAPKPEYMVNRENTKLVDIQFYSHGNQITETQFAREALEFDEKQIIQSRKAKHTGFHITVNNKKARTFCLDHNSIYNAYHMIVDRKLKPRTTLSNQWKRMIRREKNILLHRWKNRIQAKSSQKLFS